MNNLFDEDMKAEPKTNLELEVTNFGPLSHAKIDLRPLTVFVGPSNTGKSYLAILIYALNRYFSENEGFGYGWFFSRRHRVRSFRKPEMRGIIEWIKTELKGKKGQRKISPSGPVRSLMKEYFEANSRPLMAELERCFGTEIKTLKTKNSKGQCLIKVQTSSKKETVAAGFTVNPFSEKLTLEIPEVFHLSEREFERLQDLASTPEVEEDNRQRYAVAFHELLSEIVYRYTVRQLNRPVYYLPAGRTGIMQAHNVVVSALINSATMAGIRPSAGIPTLSGVLADFLDQLLNLGDRSLSTRFMQYYGRRRRRRESEIDYVAQIQSEVLDGQVTYKRDQSTKAITFEYSPDDWREERLPLRRASSMVSEVAPILLYLEHVVEEGDLLIVEEPESHLHPAKQVELIRQLAKVVESGIRVIVTTHSEWILEELSNLVRTSELRKEDKDAESGLTNDDVGVWLFNKEPEAKGSDVKEIRLDETGLYPTEFDEVAMALHNKWADIESKLSKAEEETR